MTEFIINTDEWRLFLLLYMCCVCEEHVRPPVKIQSSTLMVSSNSKFNENNNEFYAMKNAIEPLKFNDEEFDFEEKLLQLFRI